MLRLFHLYQKKKRHIQGFTLIELLVSVAIMGIITTVALFNFQGFAEKEKNNQDLNNIVLALREAQVEAFTVKGNEFNGEYVYGGQAVHFPSTGQNYFTFVSETVVSNKKSSDVEGQVNGNILTEVYRELSDGGDPYSSSSVSLTGDLVVFFEERTAYPTFYDYAASNYNRIDGVSFAEITLTSAEGEFERSICIHSSGKMYDTAPGNCDSVNQADNGIADQRFTDADDSVDPLRVSYPVSESRITRMTDETGEIGFTELFGVPSPDGSSDYTPPPPSACSEPVSAEEEDTCTVCKLSWDSYCSDYPDAAECSPSTPYQDLNCTYEEPVSPDTCETDYTTCDVDTCMDQPEATCNDPAYSETYTQNCEAKINETYCSSSADYCLVAAKTCSATPTEL